MTQFNIQMNYLTLSHALRLPLAKILGMVEIIEMGSLSEAQKTEIATIRNAGVELLHTVDNILNNCRHKKVELIDGC